MTFKIKINKKPENELSNAHVWYEIRTLGLGDKFLAELRALFVHISEHPEMHPKKAGERRTLNLKIFPYQVVYEVIRKSQVIIIISIFHGKRNPTNKFDD